VHRKLTGKKALWAAAVIVVVLNLLLAVVFHLYGHGFVREYQFSEDVSIHFSPLILAVIIPSIIILCKLLRGLTFRQKLTIFSVAAAISLLLAVILYTYDTGPMGYIHYFGFPVTFLTLRSLDAHNLFFWWLNWQGGPPFMLDLLGLAVNILMFGLPVLLLFKLFQKLYNYFLGAS